MSGGDPMVERAPDVLERLRETVGTAVYGAADTLELLLVALVAGGHVLLEDVPGTGKTRMALALARSLSLEFRRVQCTPDLLPADVLGSSVYREDDRSFEFRPGPVFCNVLLVDEINRTAPRTQAAFLEAMQEGAVSVDGRTRGLPEPFMLLATQNPVDLEGTFPLPEAQLDRFLLRASMPYPSREHEERIVRDFGVADEDTPRRLRPVADAAEVAGLRAAADAAGFDDAVRGYLVSVVRATREHRSLRLAASPRAAVSLARAARARAVVLGRDYVTPDDVKKLAEPVLAHRLLLTREAELRGETAVAVLASVIDRTAVPVETDAGTARPGH